MKKHIDWKRIGWTVLIVIGLVISILTAVAINYEIIPRTWYFKLFVLATWFYLCSFAGIFITISILHICSLIKNFYYHNGEEEK